MTHLCLKAYSYFKHHRAVYWVSMIFLFLFFGFFASRLHLEEDLNKLMPESQNADGSTKLAFADLKIKDKTFLLFDGGASHLQPAQIAEVCNAFVDSLLVLDKAQGPAARTIDNVFYEVNDDLLFDGIDYLSRHFPAYIDTSAYAHFDSLLTLPHMQAQMRTNLADLQGDVGSQFPELIEADPIGMRTVLAQQYAAVLQSTSGGYRTLEGHFFVPDSSVCVAFITPQYSATNTGQGARLFEMLNAQIEKFASAHPEVVISYHGTPASGYYNSTIIKHDLKTTILGSLLLVLLFLLLFFRKVRVLPLLLLPVVFGTLVGMAAMYFIKGEFSLLALGMGAVILGVAMSYVLHVLTHFKYVGDPERVLRDETKPVCLGCLTTIGSFMGLFFVNTSLLKDFGLFATFAIAATTLFSLFYLPQLLGRPAAKQQGKVAQAIDRFNAYPFDRNKAVVAALMLIIVICVAAWAVGGTHFDADMHDLGYTDPRVEHSEALLRDKTYTGDKTKYFATSGRTMEEAVERFGAMAAQLDSLQHVGLVKSYTPTGLLFVPLREQQKRIDAWHAYWTSERQALARRLIAATAPEAGLQPDGFESFFDNMHADYRPDALYRAGVLPAGYLSTLMEQSLGGDYLCFTSVRCANDSVRSATSDYSRICAAVAERPHQLVLDTYYYTTDALQRLNSDFNILQWVSMLFVFLVLLFSFRFNLKNTLLGLMPIVLSWLVVLGAMNLFGFSFNLINVIISTFIFGIGVDYSIFVMSGLLGESRSAHLLAYHKTAILLSALILIVTVGSMLLAKHPAIRSVGFCTLVGLTSAVAISLVLQPLLFRLLSRRS